MEWEHMVRLISEEAAACRLMKLFVLKFESVTGHALQSISLGQDIQERN
jgi:hypothetical protein